MPMPSANGIGIMDKDYGSSPSTKKIVDELKRQVSKLKTDLESERSKLKQVHRDKTGELKRIQESHEKERHKTVESVTRRLQSEHSVELRRIRESLGKEKDNELRQVLKFKDEELKSYKQQIQEEKDKNKRAEDDLKRYLTDRTKGNSNEVEQRLRDDISDLKEQKRKSDELYKLKCSADFEKAELIRRLKSDHEREVNELIRQSKREVAKEFQHLRSAEKAIEEKNHALAFKDQLTRKLEAEKQEIIQRRNSQDFTSPESPLRSRIGSGTQDLSVLESSPEADESGRGSRDKERELRKKNADLQNKLDTLEKKCAFLEKENTSRQTGTQKASSVVEEKLKKLKKRNSELVSIARQLEEKAKELQEEKNAILKQANSKADPSAEVEHMKKMFARQRAKDLAENAKSHMEKERELEGLRKELTVLSGHGSNTKLDDKVGELQLIIKKTAKERLLLERKLASAGSPCPSPISPSPTDYSIQEPNNNKIKMAENDTVRLMKELQSKEKLCANLTQTAEEMKVKCSKLQLERERFAAKCTILHQKTAELGKKVKEINKLQEQLTRLQANLQQVEQDKYNVEQECQRLKEQLEELAHVKEDLRASEQQRRILEKEHLSSVDKLNEREEEIKQLHKIQEESTRAHRHAVTCLEHDVRGLQQRCADSDQKANNTKNELEKLKTRQTHSTQHKSTQTSPPVALVAPQGKYHVPNDESRDSGVADGSKDILDTAALRIKQLAMSDSEEDSYSAPYDSERNAKPNESEDDIMLLSRRINQAAMSDESSVSTANNYDSDASHGNSMADGDMADMEDNDLTTSIVDDKDDEFEKKSASLALGQNAGHKHGTIQSKAEDKANLSNDINGTTDEARTKKNSFDGDESIDEKYLQQERSSQDEPEMDEEKLSVFIARYSYDPFQHSPNDFPDAELAFQAGDYLYVFGDEDDDGFYLAELMDGQRGLVPSNFVEKIADESDMALIVNSMNDEKTDDIYDSDEDESECKLHRNLRLNVEHIPDSNLNDIEEEEDDEDSREVLLGSDDTLISDDTDLEPFGIPSPKHVALERQFTRSVLLNWKPADLPSDEIEGYGVYVNGDMKMVIKGCDNTKALIEDIDPAQTYRISVRTLTTRGDESLDQEAMLTIGKGASVAPCEIQVSEISPTTAKLEWLPGNSSYSHEILMNGTAQRTVRPGTYQYTLTNLEPNEHYRIHIRARNPKMMFSDSTNDLERDVLAKAVEFTTQAGGLPDPPLDVHLVPTSTRSVPNTLEVSWIPVTITEHGTSNGARVTGYKVYLNDIACAEVTSPTADSVTVASWMIERVAKKSTSDSLQLVVRTQSLRDESDLSNPLTIPLETFDFKMNKLEQPAGTSVKHNDRSKEVAESRDSGNVQGYKEDNQKKEDRILERKNQINKEEKEADDTAGRDETIPALRQPPVPMPRTRGKPKVWKVDIEDATSDSADSNRSEFGGSSEVEEDEPVEICSPGAKDVGAVLTSEAVPGEEVNEILADQLQEKQLQQHQQLEQPKKQQQQQQQQDKPEQQPEQLEKQQPQLKQLSNKGSNHSSKEPEDERDNVPKNQERKMSELSDIDLDELNDSLNSATSFKREEKSPVKQKEPFITPLDFSDSEISDDEVLSIIDEVEEDDGDRPESAPIKSRSSRSHSAASDSFRSDDDVMDLLGEEPEDSQEKHVTAAAIRRVSQDHEHLEDQDDGPNHTTSRDAPSTDATREFDESIEGDRTQTYSDVEADQRAPSTPNETSTPKVSRANLVKHHDALELSMDRSGVVELEDSSHESEAEENRTYTVDDEVAEEEQEEDILRIFIALYDYDPNTMSPNPDAEDEELAFNEGDLIKIYGDQDDDGFYWGELDGLSGFVPHNMVSEVQVDDEDLLDRTASSLADTNSNQYLPSMEPNDQHQEHYAPDEEYPQHYVRDEEHSRHYVPEKEHPQNYDPEKDHPRNYVPEEEHPQHYVPEEEHPRNYVPEDDESPGNSNPENYYPQPEGQHINNPQVIVHQPSEAEIEADETSHQFPEDSDSSPRPLETPTENYEVEQGEDSSGYEDPRNSLNYSLKPRKMVALFDYDPQLLSPNPDSEVELKFRAGDILYVYGEMDEDGFFTGEQGGVRGLVPSNFLEELKDSPPTSQENSDVSGISQESFPGPSKSSTPNGTQSAKDETPKKKKGLLSKGKQMLKKMTKSQHSKR